MSSSECGGGGGVGVVVVDFLNYFKIIKIQYDNTHYIWLIHFFYLFIFGRPSNTIAKWCTSHTPLRSSRVWCVIEFSRRVNAEDIR